MPGMPDPMLAPLPYSDWKQSKITLHLMCQIVGKIRLGHVPYRSHWWNVTLQPTARGLSTWRMRHDDAFFEIEFDFIDHRLVVRSSKAHEPKSFALHEGMTIADFYATLLETLAELGISTKIVDKPYGMDVKIPFSTDTEHKSYDRVMVRRWWEATLWSADVFDRYASEFLGKESPAHLFWHSFDLAIARFSGRPAPGPRKDDVVEREAYSHEVIAVGFWPGDENTPAHAYYTYTAPEPPELSSTKLEPDGAAWFPAGAGHLGRLSYDLVRESDDPRATLMQFLHSGFNAGVKTAGWDTSSMISTYAGRQTR